MKFKRTSFNEMCRRAGVSLEHGLEALDGARIPYFRVGGGYLINTADARWTRTVLREVRDFLKYRSPTRIYVKSVRGPLAKLLEDDVYFIICGDFVKIGFGTNPAGRVKNLQIGSPYDLELAHCESGGRPKEADYHRRFAAYHHRGEWFRLEGELALFLSSRRAKPRKNPAESDLDSASD